MYERESSVGERKDVRKSVGGARLSFLGFFGSLFCPKKKFFFLISCFFFARRLCLFRVVRCFRESLHVDRKKCLKRGEKQTQRTRELLSSESNTSKGGE
jgi:hypothetical protein